MSPAFWNMESGAKVTRVVILKMSCVGAACRSRFRTSLWFIPFSAPGCVVICMAVPVSRQEARSSRTQLQLGFNTRLLKSSVMNGCADAVPRETQHRKTNSKRAEFMERCLLVMDECAGMLSECRGFRARAKLGEFRSWVKAKKRHGSQFAREKSEQWHR